MATDKAVSILESAFSNGGERTVLRTKFLPHATVFPHYHTLFAETFTLEKGSISVYQSNELSESLLETTQPLELQIGQSATIPPHTLHKYVVGDQQTVVRLIFEPGCLDFERAMLILRGTQTNSDVHHAKDSSELDQLVFTAIIAELTDANVVDNTKRKLDELLTVHGNKVETKKLELFDKYVSDGELKRLVHL